MDDYFTNVYKRRVWGDDKNSEYNGTSGGGSDIEYNLHFYILFLKNFIVNNNIKTVADLGCGNFKCGKLIYDDLDIKYIGYDTYKKLIDYNKKVYTPYEFEYLDFFNNKEMIIDADLCILKDVLQHWKMNEIYYFLDYIVESQKFHYILICNCCNQQQDNPENEGRSTPLSINFFPLKKYNPVKLFNYNTKEVSLIICTKTR